MPNENKSGDTYILGIFCYFKDASACLLRNGELVAMAEEERFSRSKHTGAFPEHAIKYCLSTAEITMDRVSAVAYGFRPLPFIAHQAAVFLRYFPKSLNLFHQEASPIPFREKLYHLLTIPQRLRTTFGAAPKVYYVDHHLAHAYSSYFVSPYDEAAILIADGFGEHNSTSFYYGSNDGIRPISSVAYPNSLGMYYGGVTEFLGFRPENDEYKVMGLCAYGENAYQDQFNKILATDGAFNYKLDTSYFDLMTHGARKWTSHKFENELGPKKRYEEVYKPEHYNIACSAQRQLEAVARRLGEDLQGKTKSKNLCVAGGIAQNILMNRVLLDDVGFNNIYVPPVAYDGGISLGSALAVHHQYFHGKRSFQLRSPSWGPEYSSDECKSALRVQGLAYEESPNIQDQVVELLAKECVVGYFDGRMEIGPRSLGNRSILADPRTKAMKDVLNARIKKREFFRPFAAMVPLEDVDKYFDMPVENPFMTLSGRVKTPELLGAVTHNDGTCRIQTVRREVFPHIYSLLRAFERKVGIPILINTSFNENEPIVCSPKEAIECFTRTKMDALVFNNQILVSKN